MAEEPRGESPIGQWLASLDLGEHTPRFLKDRVDLSVVGQLSEQDLKDLGLPLGHRRILLRAISELRANALAKPQVQEQTPRQDAELRQLTILFCDMVGSTRLSAQLDPEDMRAVIQAFYACVAEVVVQHLGMVAKYLGDGILAYFSYPEAHEDDAEQAVRAGLAIVDAVSRLAPNSLGGPSQVRIGIATGTVVVGDLLVSGMSKEQSVVGETPNLAARLQTLAEPGTVMICPNTRRLTEGHFKFRDVGPVEIKGWAEPATFYQVLAAMEVESRFGARQRTQLMPLLGRDEEFYLLLRRWRKAKQGEGQVVVLTGEPGIGKSHIAFALLGRLKSERHARLTLFLLNAPHQQRLVSVHRSA